MKNAEALQQNFQQLERQWRQVRPETDKARGESIRRIWAGETVRFEYHEFSNRAPVDRIIYESGAAGQQDLGLFIPPTIWVRKVPK